MIRQIFNIITIISDIIYDRQNEILIVGPSYGGILYMGGTDSEGHTRYLKRNK